MIQPLGNRVLIRKIEPPSHSQGGIYLGAANRPASRQGKVIGVGPEVQDLGLLDIVLLPEHGGTEVKHEGETLYLYGAAELPATITF